MVRIQVIKASKLAVTAALILLAIVLALAAWVLRVHQKKGRKHGCCGSCDSCQGCPSGHAHCPKPHKKRR